MNLFLIIEKYEKYKLNKMAEISIDQKRDLHRIICQKGFLWEDFHVIDRPKESSFRLVWLRDIIFYSFEVYYPREYKAGHIFIKFRKGEKKFILSKQNFQTCMGNLVNG